MIRRWPLEFPPNLVVRVSDAMVDQRWMGVEKPQMLTPSSGVHKHHPKGKVCHAKRRDNSCGKCRACWDPRVAHVSYPLH